MSVGISKETANLRKSRNASRMPFGHALSSRLKPLDNRSPIHPSYSTLAARQSRALASSLWLSHIAWLGWAAKIFIHQNMQELKRVQRAARTLRFARDEGSKLKHDRRACGLAGLSAGVKARDLRFSICGALRFL